ncbi:MAG: hypothetical protein K6A92_10310 [Lachnospiraceae bacterium]|nr:hypothetical protein [Lachnospiraceae bacterium]
MEKHYQRMLRDTEKSALRRMQEQELDPESPRYGGFPEGNGIVHAKVSIYALTTLLAVYFNEESRFYADPKVMERMKLGLSYIRKVQHENGLFDYITCNFFSAPDTAFCVDRFLPYYGYLKDYQGERVKEAKELLSGIEPIIHDAARGMLEGGFHTPNHRWAIASILMMCGKLFEEPKLSEGAKAYLIEGMDCNEDGEYAEKSAGNYNRVNNDAMLLLTQATGDPLYEECVLRNLKLMLSYWEPDDSVFTANSTRFDKDRLCFPEGYYMEYLRMGIKHNIPEFLGMCNRIFQIVEEKNIPAPDDLIWLMWHQELRSFEYEGIYEQPDFDHFYQDSQIVRRRKGRYTYTLLGGKSNFLYFHNGTIKLEMKVAGSFCEHRAFKSEHLEKEADGTYHLSQVMRGWYYLPFEEKPETSDWWKMDQNARKKKMGPDMHIDVWVKEAEGGIDVRVKTSGVEGGPWRIELSFTGLSFISGDALECPVSGNEVLVVKSGMLRLSNASDALLVGPCFGNHRYVDGKEDSELRNQGSSTVYFTDYTAFDHTIQIRDENTLYLSR